MVFSAAFALGVLNEQQSETMNPAPTCQLLSKVVSQVVSFGP
jgi:hypothetical protein